MWHQRFKALWLHEGDQNTRYFHYKESQRRKKNSITRIKNEAGYWKMECDAVIINYFSVLFSTSGQLHHTKVLYTISHKVDDQMNFQLIEPFNDEEIYLAVKQMHTTKARGYEGMAPLFYQKFGHIIGISVYVMFYIILLQNSLQIG